MLPRFHLRIRRVYCWFKQGGWSCIPKWFVGKGIPALLILFMTLFVIILIWPRSHIVTISSKTQVVHFQIIHRDGCTSSRVAKLQMRDGANPLRPFVRAQVTLDDRVSVTARRQGRGPLILELHPERDRQKVGSLEYDAGERQVPIPPGASILVNSEKTDNGSFILPIEGNVWIGDDVADGTDDILLEGTVAIIEKPLVSDRVVVRREPLDLGDRVTIVSASGDQARVQGFIFVELGVETSEAMNVTVRATADHATVNRTGSLGYKIGPSVWSRISADPVAVFLISLSSALAVIREALKAIYEQR